MVFAVPDLPVAGWHDETATITGADTRALRFRYPRGGAGGAGGCGTGRAARTARGAL